MKAITNTYDVETAEASLRNLHRVVRSVSILQIKYSETNQYGEAIKEKNKSHSETCIQNCVAAAQALGAWLDESKPSETTDVVDVVPNESTQEEA